MKNTTGVLVMPLERRSAMFEQIEGCGVGLMVACGLGEARALLSTRPVDLIFTDVKLPDGDWRDVMAYRTEADLRSEVILCVKRLQSALCAEAFTMGVWDVVAESCSRDELRRTIESAASRTYMRSLGSARGGAIARAAS